LAANLIRKLTRKYLSIGKGDGETLFGDPATGSKIFDGSFGKIRKDITMADTINLPQNGKRTLWIGVILTLLGFFVYVLGAAPEFFGLDRSPVVGFVQITVFLAGLGLICIGGYICLTTLWRGHQRSISADIGLRLVMTGYVISVASGMADVFGLGNQPWPQIPSFGFWQSTGVLIGQGIIVIGFIMMIPPKSIQMENS
jgi:hypothetical protein